MEFNLFTLVFLLAILTSVVALLWLNFRQDNAIKATFNEVPEGFKDTISLEEHQKAGRYTQAKLLVNHFEIITSTGVLLFWTIGGGINQLDLFWRNIITNSPLAQGTVFILSIMFIASLIDLPFSIYRNFFLEQKFGFNRMALSTFSGDLVKELLLTLIIGIPLIFIILYLMTATGGGLVDIRLVNAQCFHLDNDVVLPNLYCPYF